MRRSLAIVTAVVLVAALGGGTAAVALSKGSNATVRPRHTSLGTVLADAKGRTLYLFKKDATDQEHVLGRSARSTGRRPWRAAGRRSATAWTTRRSARPSAPTARSR